MSKNQVKLIKEFYENELKIAVANVLGIKPENVGATWTLETTTVVIDVTQNNQVTMYTFIVDNGVPSIETTICKLLSYEVAFAEGIGGRYISGINCLPSLTNVATLVHIIDAIIETCKKDYESSEACENGCGENTAVEA